MKIIVIQYNIDINLVIGFQKRINFINLYMTCHWKALTKNQMRHIMWVSNVSTALQSNQLVPKNKKQGILRTVLKS